MGEPINRRDFLRVLGAGAAAIALPIPTVSAASKKKFDSIDTLTEKMLEELGKATICDIKNYEVDYRDDSSVMVCASIGDYNLEYWGNNHKPDEKLEIELGDRDWEFSVKEKRKPITTFKPYDRYNFLFKNFNPQDAKPVVKRIKDLLDVGFHVQRGKGRDQTALVDALARKVSFAQGFNFKLRDINYDIIALHEEGDFKIEYKLDERYGLDGKFIKLTVLDGKDRLSFSGRYNNKDGKTNRIQVRVNDSYFNLESGKLTEFPSEVYTKISAMGIIGKAEQMARHLTYIVKNVPQRNYTKLFERLTSIEKDEIEVLGSGMLRAGDRTIKQYGKHITLTAPNQEYGQDRIRISPLSEDICFVKVNGHPFEEFEGRVKFIGTTYTYQQASLIIDRAKKLDHIINSIR